ncbi:Olfactory receptor 1052 [Pteropus alecto]|uniref:Olfactory receptor n=2 Tax=Pteropus alecto TaxID=9402 RepID=L5KPF5_PTEAL|nr:Olfactory receptor 1052 [Pteropus alecto]
MEEIILFHLSGINCSAAKELNKPECMAGWNHTGVKEFILVGLTENPNLQIPLFLLFTFIYFITMVGNWGMITLIWLNAQLHTPMYFFLSNLSFCDICYSTVFAPKMLVNFLSKHKSSTFSGCVLQSFLFSVYVTTEGILLSVMAYDRYVAIANPLLYAVIMTQRVCIQMVLASYLGGLINSLTHTIGLLKLDFCGPNIVNHYFCDFPPLLRLSCSDVHKNEMLILVFSGVIAMFTFIIIMVSYIRIIIAIQRIRSAEGRRKAFSTCASHLTAVTLFYGSVTFSYIQPSSQYSLEQEKVSAVFYTLVIPMLNPLIYSLRNKDVKDAAKRSICWKRTST